MATDKIQFTLRLNPLAHHKLGLISYREYRSLNHMIEHWIEDGIRRDEEQHGALPTDTHDLRK